MTFSSVNEAPRFRLTEWLSGSGEADKTPLPLSRTSGKLGAYPQRRSHCPTGAGVRRHYGFLQFSLFSALKFVGCWSLEERYPWLHRAFGNVEAFL